MLTNSNKGFGCVIAMCFIFVCCDDQNRRVSIEYYDTSYLLQCRLKHGSAVTYGQQTITKNRERTDSVEMMLRSMTIS